MKTIKMKTSLLSVIFGCLLSFITPVSAQDVAQYFSRIPRQVFTEGTTRELVKLARGDQGVVDTKNGYFRLDGDGAQVSLQVALFRFTDRSPLLVVAWGELEEPDFTHVTLFRETGGKMVVADRKILPVADSPGLRFELPRHGRTVIVRDAAGKTVSKWTWSGEEFLR
ncbi:MAG: hypothetical protein QM627_05110 [Luteolibacter sp.]